MHINRPPDQPLRLPGSSHPVLTFHGQRYPHSECVSRTAD